MNVEMVEQLRKQSAFIVRKDGPGRSTLEFGVYESPQGFTGKFAAVCAGIWAYLKRRKTTLLTDCRDIATQPWFIIGFFRNSSKLESAGSGEMENLHAK